MYRENSYWTFDFLGFDGSLIRIRLPNAKTMVPKIFSGGKLIHLWLSTMDNWYMIFISGVTQIFKRLDVGSLDIGDYLGTCHCCTSLVNILHVSSM